MHEASDSGDVRGEEVDAVAVKVATCSVVVLSGERVGMPGKDLRVAQRNPPVSPGRPFLAAWSFFSARTTIASWALLATVSCLPPQPARPNSPRSPVGPLSTRVPRPSPGRCRRSFNQHDVCSPLSALRCLFSLVAASQASPRSAAGSSRRRQPRTFRCACSASASASSTAARALSAARVAASTACGPVAGPIASVGAAR